MTAAVGYPTLLLVRRRIGGWEIGDLAMGVCREAGLSLLSVTLLLK